MAVLKVLDVLLRGNTSIMDKDFKKGERIIQGFRSRLVGFAAAAVPTISFAGIAAGIGSAISQLDSLEERAQKFQIDPGSLVSLERIAGQAGVEVSGLSAGIGVLNRQMLAAVEGNQTAIKSFGLLGLKVGDLEKLTVEQRLVKIAKALKTVEGDFKKTAIAQKLFGKQGINLLPLLADGGDEIAKSFKRTKELGGIFSNAQLAIVSKANNLYEDLVFTIGNLSKAFAVQLSPVLSDIFTDLIEMTKPGTAFRELLDGIGTAAIETAKSLRDIIDIVKQLSDLAGGENLKGFGKLFGRSLFGGGINAGLRSGLEAFTPKVKPKIEADGAIDQFKKKFGELELPTIKPTLANPQSINAGSQEDFQVRYGVTIQAPINELIGVAKEGNGLLGSINEKLRRNGVPDGSFLPEDFS